MAHHQIELELPDRMIEVCPGQWVDALSIMAIGANGRMGVTGDYYSYGDKLLPVGDLLKQINEIKRAYARVGVFQ